ncbi:MAG: VacJ family lipoprotein [bacterium]|nr:VacJ family lipoprotein [bacterium]
MTLCRIQKMMWGKILPQTICSRSDAVNWPGYRKGGVLTASRNPRLRLLRHAALTYGAGTIPELPGIGGERDGCMSMSRVMRMPAVATVVLLVVACAEVPDDPVEHEIFIETNDPLEPTNRTVFDFDVTLLDHALSPVALAYRDHVPGPVRDGVSNVLDNLQMPVTILNSGLQGDFDNMAEATSSFFINSTAGIAGLFDIPANSGRKPRREDFGQTLAVWGMEEGPYLVLPLVGPSSARDTVGLGVDIMTDPLTWLLTPAWSYVRTGAATIDSTAREHDRIEVARQGSIDFYATARSLYRQNRAREIANGVEDPFGFDDTFEE